MDHPLAYIFRSATRSELGQFICRMILAPDPAHLQNGNYYYAGKLPLTFCLAGDNDAGKSFIWDETVQALLGSSAALDPSNSKDLTTNDRIYETWKGLHVEGNTPLTIFLINISSIYFKIEDDLALSQRLRADPSDPFRVPPRLRNYNPRELFGDLVMISNPDSDDIDRCDLLLTLKREDNNKDSWERRLIITVKSPALKKDKAFTSFLDNNCERIPA